MGDKEPEPFQFTFNGFLKVAFQESCVTNLLAFFGTSHHWRTAPVGWLRSHPLYRFVSFERTEPGFPFWTSQPSPLYTQNLLPEPICCCGPLGMPSKPSAGCARRSRRANRGGSGTFLRHLPHVAPCRRPRSRDAIGRQPAGTGSAQIRWSIAPNSRRVRWLSASRSQ